MLDEIPPFVMQNLKMRLFFHALGLISAGDPVLSSLSMSWNILDGAKNGDTAGGYACGLYKRNEGSRDGLLNGAFDFHVLHQLGGKLLDYSRGIREPEPQDHVVNFLPISDFQPQG